MRSAAQFCPFRPRPQKEAHAAPDSLLSSWCLPGACFPEDPFSFVGFPMRKNVSDCKLCVGLSLLFRVFILEARAQSPVGHTFSTCHFNPETSAVNVAL